MKRFHRYIGKTIISTSLIVLLIMIILDTFFNFLNEVEDIGKNDYNLTDIFLYLTLTLPNRLENTLPIALLVGGLLGIGSLANHSEITAMRAAGWSPLRLSSSALLAGALLSCTGFVLVELVAPQSERMAKNLRSQAKAGTTTIYGQGFWARDDRLYINVGRVMPGPQLLEIIIYELDQKSNLKSITYATAADYHDDHWRLHNVIYRGLNNSETETKRLPQVPWDSILEPAILEVLTAEPDELAISELYRYIQYLQNSQLNTKAYELAFWRKALAPATSLSLLFVALTFAFAPQRRTGAGQRLMVGVILGLLFFLLDRIVGNFVLLIGYPPLLGASLPMLLFTVFGAVALHRTR